MPTLIKRFVIVLSLLTAPDVVFAAENGEWFVVNEDNSHFYVTRKRHELDVEHLEAFVDQYALGKVTHLFFCPNGMRANFRSDSREAIWDPVPGVPESTLEEMLAIPSPHHWPAHARIFHDKGIDPYAVWIRRCREKGISPWLTMRMNDNHHVMEPLHVQHSEFWRSNPQFRRIPGFTSRGWSQYCLDFAHPEVRKHQMDFILELLDRYDADGIELDWMRMPHHFREGRYEEDAHFMDDFMREVRRAAEERSKQRGRKIGVSVRVPSHPDVATGLGLDAPRWAKAGWVDVIVAATQYMSTDFDIRFDLWRERIGDATKSVKLLACAERGTTAFPGAERRTLDLPMLFAFVDNARSRGADGVYLFNWFDSGATMSPRSNYRKLIEEGISQDRIMRSERRYPICYRDTRSAKIDRGVQLPKETDRPVSLRISLGTPPESATVSLIVGFEQRDGLETAPLSTTLSATLNGKELGAAVEETDLGRLPPKTARAVRMNCPSEAIVADENRIEFSRTEGASQRIIWTELRVVP